MGRNSGKCPMAGINRTLRLILCLPRKKCVGPRQEGDLGLKEMKRINEAMRRIGNAHIAKEKCPSKQSHSGKIQVQGSRWTLQYAHKHL